jgi:hypothetical protein
MRRAVGGLVVILCAAGLVAGQGKDKDKGKKETPKVKAY